MKRVWLLRILWLRWIVLSFRRIRGFTVWGIPQPSAVYTAAIMLAGKNLDGIRGMIHDVDPDTGA
ncbi:hypothetical protein RN270_001925 [Salmonella enterica]|nr:hypothetical protein [Salmonella enterica]